jgi:hypothetical protein
MNTQAFVVPCISLHLCLETPILNKKNKVALVGLSKQRQDVYIISESGSLSSTLGGIKFHFLEVRL